MRKLQKFERGTVIADRYVVSEELRPWLVQFPEKGTILLGLDAILDSPVILYVSPSEQAGDLLDAGRRSALLSDPRIPAILDVGVWEGFDFVVCERSGGTSLARLLRSGPISGEAARAVIGELATALTHAANRGLHHGILGPESVAITTDCEVIVRGVAIDAVIADEPLGLELSSKSSAALKRDDAMSLVHLLYTCLSGHWPGETGRAGLPASGMKNNRIAAIDAIINTASLPSDLEAFASNVITGIEPGPRSPSEIVRYLGTWDSSVLADLDHSARTEDELFEEPAELPVPAEPAEQTVEPGTSGTARIASGSRTPGLPDTQRRSGATQEQLQAALARIGLSRPGTHGLSAGVQGSRSFEYDERMQMRQASTFPIAADQLDPTAQWPDDEESTYSEYDPNETVPLLNRGDFESSPSTQAIDIVDEEPEPHDESGDDDGSWFLGGMFQTREQQLESQRAEYERERRLERQARARLEAQHGARAESADADADSPSRGSGITAGAAGTAAVTSVFTARSSSRDGDDPTTLSDDSPAAESQPAGRAQSSFARMGAPADGEPVGENSGSAAVTEKRRKVLPFAFSALALFAAVVLSIFVFLRPGDAGRQADPAPVPSEQSTQEPQPEKTEAQDSEDSPSGTAVTIVKASSLDPEGDGKENDAAAKKVIPGTKGAWQSDRYSSEKFGALKTGLGLALELEEKTTVSQVSVESTATGGSFDVYVGDSDSVSDAKKVGSGEFKKGKDDTIDIDEPVEGSTVIIWITELPEMGKGYRAGIAKVTVTS